MDDDWTQLASLYSVPTVSAFIVGLGRTGVTLIALIAGIVGALIWYKRRNGIFILAIFSFPGFLIQLAVFAALYMRLGFIGPLKEASSATGIRGAFAFLSIYIFNCFSLSIFPFAIFLFTLMLTVRRYLHNSPIYETSRYAEKAATALLSATIFVVYWYIYYNANACDAGLHRILN